MRIILIGGTRTVYYLARQFTQRRYHVTVINRDQVQCSELAQQTRATVIWGDGTDVGRLEEAGARQADALLALTPYDQDNLVACQIAQHYFGVPRTVALVNDPENEPIFQKLGVSVAFSATRIIGTIIEQETDFDNITTLMPLAQGRINVTDVRLDADSPAVGKTLLELELADDTLVACVIRDEDAIVPRGSTRLQAGDHLILISHPENEERDLETLCG
jgi:trk system potassium uptake protein